MEQQYRCQSQYLQTKQNKMTMVVQKQATWKKIECEMIEQNYVQHHQHL
jgi:hypothetical protein